MPTRTVQPVSNPYAGGAIVADFTPYLNLALQQKAKEDAKAAAAQKVYEDMMKDPNPNGIREKDTADFYNMTNSWRRYGIDNKEALKNPAIDNGKALSEFRKMTTEIAGYVNSSKERKEKEKQFAPFFSDPEKSKMLTDNFMKNYQTLQLPINQSKGFSMNLEDAFGAKPLDEKKAIDYLVSGMKPSDLSTTFAPIQGDKFNRLQVTEKAYEPTAIGNKAKDFYRTNESFKVTIDNLWKESGMKINPDGTITPPTGYVADLQQIYVDDKGKPIPIQTKDDLAAAWAIAKIRPFKEQKTVPYKEAIMEAEEAMRKRLIGESGKQARLTKGFTTEKVPFVERVEDVEELIKAPDTKDAQGNVNLLKAADILRTVAEATVGTTGEGTFMTPLPSSSSMKSDIAANPQYQTIIKEGEDSIEQALPEADRKAYKNTITNPNITREQFAAIKADAYNKINEKNGISHRFTADKVRNQTPVFTRIIKSDGTVINSVLPLGTNEFRQTYGGAATEYKRKAKSKTSEFESSSESESQSAGGGQKVVAPNVKTPNFVQPSKKTIKGF